MMLAKYNLPVCPINDTQEPKDTNQSEDNKSRCKLASAFRLIDVKAWSQHIYNYISTRCTQVPTQFYTNPFGKLFSEITASTIIKLDFNGNIVQQGITDYGYFLPGFHIQSAIYQARSDINCIIHLHEPLLAGITATKQGFLPLTFEGLICNEMSYFDYMADFNPSVVDDMVKALGTKNRILVLRNHGVLVCGSTLEETCFYLCMLIQSSRTQLVASIISKDVQDLIVLPITESLGDRDKVFECYNKMNTKASDNIVWKLGELEYEAEMRKLDLMGFQTGYPYKKKFHVQGVYS